MTREPNMANATAAGIMPFIEPSAGKQFIIEVPTVILGF
jgi:hypothetical protein